MKTYTAVEALELFTKGKRLRRTGWGEDYAQIESNRVDGVVYKFIQRRSGQYKTSLSITDLINNDWEDAPNEMACRCCGSIVKRW